MRLIENIKNEFPILSQSKHGDQLVYLDSAASTQKPKQVIDGISRFMETSYANVHRGLYHLSQQSTYEFERARGKISLFLHAKNPKEIVFTRSLTEGINLLANVFAKPKLQAGDEVLISGMEHHSNLIPWQMVCEETKAILKIIPILDNGELDMKAYASLLNQKTKVVSVTHVSNVLGTINPIQEMVRLAHDQNIPVIVDGAQSASHLAVNVQDLDCDFYLITGHKLYGPTGTGAIYGKYTHWEKMKPYHGGGEMVEEVTYEKSTYKEPPARFEAGTPNIVGSIGLGYAIDFIQSVGMDNVMAHEKKVFEYANKKIKSIQGIRIIGDAKNKIGLISFVMEGFHPHDVASILDQQGIAVRVGHHCAQPLHQRFHVTGTIRFCLGMYNTEKDIDRLIEGLEKAQKMLA